MFSFYFNGAVLLAQGSTVLLAQEFSARLQSASTFSKAFRAGGAFGAERPNVCQRLVEARDELVVGDDGLVDERPLPLGGRVAGAQFGLHPVEDFYLLDVQHHVDLGKGKAKELLKVTDPRRSRHVCT
jgi:hypothetical protein